MLPTLYSLAASLTDKLLKGARPADTPAEQPTKFELIINRKAADAIGVEIPPSILALADTATSSGQWPVWGISGRRRERPKRYTRLSRRLLRSRVDRVQLVGHRQSVSCAAIDIRYM